MPSGTLVIANPKSGGGATRRLWRHLERPIRRALGPLQIEHTRGPSDAGRIAREAVRAGVDRLVVVGGDGTLSEVVSGLLSADLGRYAEIGLVPMGTGGDLARTLGIPRDPEAALAAIASGKQRRLDAGRAHYRDGAGREVTSHFLNVASAGASAIVAELVNGAGKLLGGRLSFLVGAVRGILRYRNQEASLRVDGELTYEGPVALVAAANGRYFGGGMLVAPDARPDDGVFDVIVVEGISKSTLLRKFPAVYRGVHIGLEGVSLLRGRRVEIEAAPGVLRLELDGEPLGAAPARFEIVPDAVTLLGTSA